MKRDENYETCRIEGRFAHTKAVLKDECRAYFKRLSGGGRSGFARALDYVALRAILLACAYLYFLPRFQDGRVALLLSLIALAIVMLILRVAREIAFDRFVQKESARIRNLLLTDRLLLLDMQSMIGLCSGLCPFGEAPIVLQRALPIDADAISSLLRTHMDCERLHVFATAAYEKSAKAFAARFDDRLVLHGPEELLDAAKKSGMSISQTEIDEYIVRQQRQRKAVKHELRRQRAPFERAYAKRYGLIALLLMGASFLTRYALYYRMLSGLCMTIAACGAMLPRGGAHQS